MKFVVSVTETLNRLVCVEADSRDEAMEKASLKMTKIVHGIGRGNTRCCTLY